MPDKHSKIEEAKRESPEEMTHAAEESVESSTIEAMPAPQPEASTRSYFFPPAISIEAASLEEALTLYEKSTKGAH